MNLYISPTGEVMGVYDDAIPKEKLGNAEVTRASNVEFNETLQRWEAIVPVTGEVMCHDPNRNECLRQEKVIVEAMMLQNILRK